MAWERRPGGLYYYRSVRRDGRVRKVYFGRGEAAALAARLDAEARRRRADEAAAVASERDRLRPLDEAAAAVQAACALMTEAVLVAEGFRRVDYRWRRHRARTVSKV
jgi:hypothetical protein